MKKMRYLAVLLSAAAVINLTANYNIKPIPVSARDYEAEIAALEKKAEALKKKNAEREKQIKSAEYSAASAAEQKKIAQIAVAGVKDEVDAKNELINLKLDAIDQKEIAIDQKEADIAIKEADIARKDADMEIKQKQIDELQADNDEKLMLFGDILRGLYMNGGGTEGDVLAGDRDYYDILIQSKITDNVADISYEYMTALLDDIADEQDRLGVLNIEKAGLEHDKEIFLTEKATLESDKELLEKALNELETEKAELDKELLATQATYRSYIKEYDKLMSQINNLEDEIGESDEEMAKFSKQIEKLIKQQQEAAKAASQNGGATYKDYTGTGFTWPLEAKFHKIYTYFGYDAWRKGQHNGIDVGDAGIAGSNIYAAQEGTVLTAYNDGGYHGGYGNYVVIDHGGGISTLYAHTQTGKVTVKVGDHVSKGQKIAQVGKTGHATGNHLHFEVRISGKPVNPFNYKYQNSNYYG
ncbi:MAG: peptidoglycan DD-metalloendopeptidase family protein [Oscillospiraceae bacterium]|jgi:murein DD-endopeptidase MepM/ murein hydrolase activator NlpD|nr:peptidoglycan DD-metalloendopeptidase family protein [Oscillospiraceae bacterium]